MRAESDCRPMDAVRNARAGDGMGATFAAGFLVGEEAGLSRSSSSSKLSMSITFAIVP